jgi:hypothetical protein
MTNYHKGVQSREEYISTLAANRFSFVTICLHSQICHTYYLFTVTVYSNTLLVTSVVI